MTQLPASVNRFATEPAAFAASIRQQPAGSIEAAERGGGSESDGAGGQCGAGGEAGDGRSRIEGDRFPWPGRRASSGAARRAAPKPAAWAAGEREREILHNLVEASTGLFRYPYSGRLAVILGETEPVCIIV